MDLIVHDFEEINIKRQQMVAKLLVNLVQGTQKGLINNQSSGVAACARQIISLAGLAVDSQYNSREGELLIWQFAYRKQKEGLSFQARTAVEIVIPDHQYIVISPTNFASIPTLAFYCLI